MKACWKWLTKDHCNLPLLGLDYFCSVAQIPVNYHSWYSITENEQSQILQKKPDVWTFIQDFMNKWEYPRWYPVPWLAHTANIPLFTFIRGIRMLRESRESYLAEVASVAPGRPVRPIWPESAVIWDMNCVKMHTTATTIWFTSSKFPLSDSGRVELVSYRKNIEVLHRISDLDMQN